MRSQNGSETLYQGLQFTYAEGAHHDYSQLIFTVIPQ